MSTYENYLDNPTGEPKREKLYRIKPLEWYQASFGWYGKHGMGGEYFASDDGFWAVCCASGDPNRAEGKADSLKAGKAACEAHWRARLEAVLEEFQCGGQECSQWP